MTAPNKAQRACVIKIFQVLLSVGLLCVSTVATSNSPPNRMFSGDSVACQNKDGGDGAEATCLASQLFVFASAIQIMRYSYSFANGEDVHRKISLTGTIYDAYCALDLMKSYNSKLSRLASVKRRQKKEYQNKPETFVRAAWDEYHNRHEEIVNRDWNTYYGPKFANYAVNKSKAAVGQGVVKELTKAKLMKDPMLQSDPNALMFKGLWESKCNAKVQEAIMGLITKKKKSGLDLVTGNGLWDLLVTADSKTSTYTFFADAMYKSGFEGKSAADQAIESLGAQIHSEMGQYGYAEKIKAKKILNNIRDLMMAAKNSRQDIQLSQLNMEAETTQSHALKNFDNKLKMIIKDGEFFDNSSQVGKYTEYLKVFREHINGRLAARKAQKNVSVVDEVEHQLPEQQKTLTVIHKNYQTIIIANAENNECNKRNDEDGKYVVSLDKDNKAEQDQCDYESIDKDTIEEDELRYLDKKKKKSIWERLRNLHANKNRSDTM